MAYKIVKTVVEYKDGKPFEIFVLWDDSGLYRATFANLNKTQGYTSIDSSEAITDAVVQRVAGYGSYITDNQKKEHFPKVKNWSR